MPPPVPTSGQSLAWTVLMAEEGRDDLLFSRGYTWEPGAAESVAALGASAPRNWISSKGDQELLLGPLATQPPPFWDLQ